MKLAVYSLIDITDTGIRTDYADKIKLRNQQRNWETAYQIVGLHNEVNIIVSPLTPKMVIVDHHDFGEFYSEQHRCWKFIFQFQFPHKVSTDTEVFRTLAADFNRVPVITGLDETITLPDPVFRTSGPLKNTYFKILPEKD
jgi:hypothetical protein